MPVRPLRNAYGILVRTDVGQRRIFFEIFRDVCWQALPNAYVMLFFYYGRGSTKNMIHVLAEGGCSDLVTNRDSTPA